MATATPKDERLNELFDPRWLQRTAALNKAGIALTPLLLVQVASRYATRLAARK